MNRAKEYGWAPITVTRLHDDLYIVGRVHLSRELDGSWAARAGDNHNDRPMFTAPDLAGILDMAHGAVEMMRPAATTTCMECGAEISVGHFCIDCRATS